MELISDDRERLDRFLARKLPEHSRSKLARLIADGLVMVEGRAEKPSFLLSGGQRVTLDEPTDSEAHDLSPAEIDLDIVYEDAHLLVVNKPRGLAAHPAKTLHEPSLVNALLARSHALSTVGGDFRPGIVHRLDKETTGLMIVAKTDAAHVKLARQIETKAAERRYFAVVAGVVSEPKFRIDAPIGRDKRNRTKMAVDPNGKPAATVVMRIGRLERGWLIGAKLETGRTHQIRVHLSSLGMPVFGDSVYAPKAYREGPMQLHAAFLSFTHPISENRIQCYAEPPTDFMGRELATQDSLTSI